MLPKFLAGLVLALTFTLSALPARAGLSTDLQNLVVQGTALRASLSTISVSQGNTCTQLDGFNAPLRVIWQACKWFTASLRRQSPSLPPT